MSISTSINGKTDLYRWQTLYAKKLELDIVEVFMHFKAAGIEPLLFKGWAAARSYSEGTIRTYTDIDLAVSAADFSLADQIRTIGGGQRFMIDLHCELRHLDSRPWADIFRDSLLVDLDCYKIRIPSAEDHLRILSTHWLNDRGESKEKLWDIYYAVANRPEDFSWSKCLGVVSPNRRTWVIMSIAAAHKYLGLPVDDLPFADEARDLPKWLTRSLEASWASGSRLRPLSLSLRDPKILFQQIRMRIPPSAIQSTIESDGDLIRGPRSTYQLRSMGRRALRSLSKLYQVIRHRRK